jgi:hypothetical protein
MTRLEMIKHDDKNDRASRERSGGACFSLPAAERSSPWYDGDGRLKPAPPQCAIIFVVVFRNGDII